MQAAEGNNYISSLQTLLFMSRICNSQIRYEQMCDRGLLAKRTPMFCTNLFHCTYLGHLKKEQPFRTL